MSWKNWKFRQIYSLGLKYQYFYSMSRGHPESYIMEKLCLMNSLARLLLFLVYDNHFWPKNTVIISFFLKFKKMTMNLHQYCNKQNPPLVISSPSDHHTGLFFYHLLTLSGTTPLLWTFGTGGGQKHLRYIIQIYISQFKSDYSGVKSKSEVHIIRSHLEKKKIAKTFKNGWVIVVFVCHSKIPKKFEKKNFGTQNRSYSVNFQNIEV